MFCIFEPNSRLYFHKDGKIIAFNEDEQEKIQWFIQQFSNYCSTQIVNNLSLAFQLPQILQGLQIIPIPESITCGTINFNELNI